MSTPLPEGGKKPQRRIYLREAVALLKGIRLSVAAVAFCMAVTLWYTVTVRDKVESWVDVQVVFKGAPENLIISDGLINKIAVRVRVARGLSRGLTGRDAAVVVDLSSITKGSNAIAVTREMLPFNSAYEVMEVSPSRILVEADTLASRELALETWFEGKLAPDLYVKSASLSPRQVLIQGGEKRVSAVSRLRIPVMLNAGMVIGTSSQTVAVPAPANVMVTPPQVTVDLEIGVKTKQVRITRPVLVAWDGKGESPAVTPKRVTVVAEIPESFARDEKKMDSVTAEVTLPADTAPGARSALVRVSLPENATLISVTPAEVQVKVGDPGK